MHLSQVQPSVTEESLRQALREVMDPEAGMNIVDLGLVYRISLDDDKVLVDLTMTSPACPLGEMIVEEARGALQKTLPPSLPLVINLVWSPPWEPSMMSPQAKVHFGW